LELVDEVRGERICIDTPPIIYFIEHQAKYRNIIRPVFAEIAAGNIEANYFNHYAFRSAGPSS
jgi:hypothetical protein